MGKGKGKLDGWVGQLSAGTNLFEFKNLRTGRALYFIKQVKYRLPVKATIGFYSRLFVTLPWKIKVKIPFTKFK